MKAEKIAFLESRDPVEVKAEKIARLKVRDPEDLMGERIATLFKDADPVEKNTKQIAFMKILAIIVIIIILPLGLPFISLTSLMICSLSG